MTTEKLPLPFAATDCDMSDVPSFPFNARKFRNSEFANTVDPATGFAAILLWAAAWQQVPAASLPDNDAALANMAGFGRNVDAFLKIKAGALYGFVKCSDGRLYHQHLAEQANHEWFRKKEAEFTMDDDFDFHNTWNNQ